MKVSCAIIKVLKLFKSDHTQTQLCNIYKAKARVISNEGLFVTVSDGYYFGLVCFVTEPYDFTFTFLLSLFLL